MDYRDNPKLLTVQGVNVGRRSRVKIPRRLTDFLLEARSRSTGEIRQLIVEAIGFEDEDYKASKAATHPRMTQIAPVVSISPTHVHEGHVRHILTGALDA